MTFSSVSPPHAYPTKFPPSCNYDPFPVRNGGFTFPAPLWMRKPSSSQPEKKTTNFNEFVLDFSTKLVLRDSSSRKHPRTSNTLDASIRPWFSATHTTAPSAPHTALVRRHPPPVPQPCVSSTNLPTTPAPLSRLHPFRPPSSDSGPVWRLPSVQCEAPAPRKVARLPLRAPKHTSIAHRGVSPTISDVPSPSPLRSLSSSSSVSSFSSDTSFDRRPSSSGSSTASSTVSTPDSTSISLPEICFSLSFSGVHCQDKERFGTITVANAIPSSLNPTAAFSRNELHCLPYLSPEIHSPERHF
jgi:hypothetical protein